MASVGALLAVGTIRAASGAIAVTVDVVGASTCDEAEGTTVASGVTVATAVESAVRDTDGVIANRPTTPTVPNPTIAAPTMAIVRRAGQLTAFERG
jgi:hypothetical protein